MEKRVQYKGYKFKGLLLLYIITCLLACGSESSTQQAIPPPTDNVKPIADAGEDISLTIEGSETKTVTLIGTASDVDGSIVAHQWKQIAGTSVPISGANSQSATVSIPAATETYTFQYTATDNEGATASDSTSVSATRLIFEDRFSDGSGWSTRWESVNDSQKFADWFENAGQLLQREKVDGIDLAYHKGTYAYLENPPVAVPDSYRFSVDITPLPNNGNGDSEGNDIGIMFRYLDSDNYYRVSMNARSGFTRFEKCRFGAYSTLAVNAIGYVENQPVTLTADIDGDKIVIFIDGDPVFAVKDAAVGSGTVALYCQDRVTFDNVTLLENPKQPTVVIASPLAYSVALSSSDGNTLSAEALVLDKPAGANVFFSLDDGDEVAAVKSGDLYLAEFQGISVGEHELAAILKTGDGEEISVDINSTIGVGGDYYVTVGDSITNGEGDLFPANNETIDGRMIGIQGYQAELAERLLNATQRPQIVFNEGVGGDTAADLNGRIKSILDRHPKANKVLLMIGTNDAGERVSAGNYASSVRSVVDKIVIAQGKQLWIAKPPPTFVENSWQLDAIRNGFIVQYNQIVNAIAEENPFDATELGPNFFQTMTAPFYFNDYLHPNDTGYQFMAGEWLKKVR